MRANLDSFLCVLLFGTLWRRHARAYPSIDHAILQSDECIEVKSSMAAALELGDLSKARRLAFDALISGCNEKLLRDCYQKGADALFRDTSFEQITASAASSSQARLTVPEDAKDCWNIEEMDYQMAPDLWDECCAQVPSPKTYEKKLLPLLFSEKASRSSRCLRPDGSTMCCNLSTGTASYLRLPALRELALTLELPSDNADVLSRVYHFEQDGFLRPHDVAGVLWPTAYLLSLCLAAPYSCGVGDVLFGALTEGLAPPKVLELGVGIGAPSIVLAKTVIHDRSWLSPPSILATDQVPQALALTLANAHAANVSNFVQVELLDHNNATQLETMRRRYPAGFSVVLGSALQNFFEDDVHLWSTLDGLMDSSNRRGVVFLAHTVPSLLSEHSSKQFRHLQTVSGNQFGLFTGCGETSEFELSVFTRNQPAKSSPAEQDEL